MKKLYYSISEISEITDLKKYVIRFWETEFENLRPKKNKAGNRIYKQQDLDLIITIKDLLYNHEYTIKGAKKRLKISSKKSTDKLIQKNDGNSGNYVEILSSLKRKIENLLAYLNGPFL